MKLYQVLLIPLIVLVLGMGVASVIIIKSCEHIMETEVGKAVQEAAKRELQDK